MSVEETCDSCTQNENVWVTTIDDQELCVDNLVEWGKYFSKFVTKNEECQGSIIQSQSDTEIGMIISAVVVVLVFGGWAAYALYRRYRRRSQDRYLLLPYVELHRGVSEDEISLETNFSVQSSSEAGSSTSEYPKSSTQSDTDTDAEPKPKLKIKTEPESGHEPDAETEPKTKTEPEPDAETEPKTKTEPEPDAETEPKTKTETGTDAASETDEEHYFPAHENNSSSDSDSSFSLHGETTLEDEDSDANTSTYLVKKEKF